MTAPRTTLDPRFSDPGNEPTSCRNDWGGIAHVDEVRPTTILAFGKHPFTHTRHVPA